ncbi:MAG TPA: VgrG-related protein [Dehalococcoidia bacterium]|nr:VgrG-related protein [Dehalococcoidia bacterium]
MVLPSVSPTLNRPITQVYVKLDGRDLDPGLVEGLLRVSVNGSVHLPDLAILEFDNPDMRWSDVDAIRIGQEMTVGFGDNELQSEEPVFMGDVTALDLDVGMDGSVKLIVRGYDRSHRLHRGRQTKVYENVKDSDIAMQIASELGFETIEIQTTPGTHDYVLQDNQTNWEFLRQRAARHGYELQVRDKKLVFKPPPSTERRDVDLTWNQELISFRASMTTGDQVNKVEVRGWDPVNKETVLGTADSAQTLPDVPGATFGGNAGGAVAQLAFQREAVMVVARQPIYSQEDADRLAQSVLEDLAGSFITAQGVAAGNPELQLGSKVNVKDVGRQFSGSYMVTQITHNYEPESYTINFEVTGRRSTDLVSLLEAPPHQEMNLLTGMVMDLNDPEGLGRVKVSLPQLGPDIYTAWCRLVAPGAGATRGIYFLPEIDDEVLLMGTSMDNLYILGGLWNNRDQPPYDNSDAAPNGAVMKRTIRSREGHEILLDDDPREPGISIIDKEGNKLLIKSRDNSMTIDVQGDIKFKTPGNFEIDATGNISMSATGNFNAEAMGNASVEANGQATLRGTAGVRAESSANAALSAPSVSLG